MFGATNLRRQEIFKQPMVVMVETFRRSASPILILHPNLAITPYTNGTQIKAEISKYMKVQGCS